ncbi:DUF5329 domain-containing protein [Cupriavidus sp. WKF15]|uniref:DUF5329 domain-containing protein n=1 Tax=Cupriavidus sp. WKF15 TaxID=3032282 RepID=UPI0023E25589|nr:DUF5329 domain-containing protein [Cupriavidus sp. WKF15]WER46668.1 DUF5329 domain-containing protein [Cupriavidus sp. WKF15]
MATMVAAGEARPAVQLEITSLLSRLETSGCRFNRNGVWHTASEAKSHLLTKLHYIEDRTTLVSTEQFIELAGSKSSFSGKPYLVQCGNAAAQPSAVWLTAQLHSLRAASKRP